MRLPWGLGLLLTVGGCTTVFGLDDPTRRMADAAIDSLDAPPPPDRDSDGVADELDNCPDHPNDAQANGDGDIAGDVCDVCPALADDQTNADGDAFGNRCDNCPAVANPNQANADGDGLGDACDAHPSEFDCTVAFESFSTLDGWTPVVGTWTIEDQSLVQSDASLQGGLILSDATYKLPFIAVAGYVLARGAGNPSSIGVWGAATPTQSGIDGLLIEILDPLNSTASTFGTTITDASQSSMTSTLSPAIEMAVTQEFVIAADLRAAPSYNGFGTLENGVAGVAGSGAPAVGARVGIRSNNTSIRVTGAWIVERNADGMCPPPAQ